ncbi:MAG: helix-turn-helix domain-containing protein [bacterium]
MKNGSSKILNFIAIRFNKALELKSTTVPEISKNSGISLSTLYNISKGKNFSIEVLEKICNNIEIPISFFFDTPGSDFIQSNEKHSKALSIFNFLKDISEEERMIFFEFMLPKAIQDYERESTLKLEINPNSHNFSFK